MFRWNNEYISELRVSYRCKIFIISSVILSWVYNEPTQWPAPFVSSICRALHRYHTGQGSDSRTILHFFTCSEVATAIVASIPGMIFFHLIMCFICQLQMFVVCSGSPWTSELLQHFDQSEEATWRSNLWLRYWQHYDRGVVWCILARAP